MTKAPGPAASKPPSVNVLTLKPGTKLIVESELGSIYSIEFLGGRNVVVYGSLDGFAPFTKNGYFVGSADQKAVQNIDMIVKGLRAVFQFFDAQFVTEALTSARVEGPGWHYNVF